MADSDPREVAIIDQGSGWTSPRWWRHIARGERTLCGVDLGGDLPGGAPPEVQAAADAAPMCMHCARGTTF